MTRTADADFERFVLAQSTPLLRFAEVLCGDRYTAEDLVQQALMRSYPKWHKLDGDPLRYVRRVVVNRFLSQARRRWNNEVPSDPVHNDWDQRAVPARAGRGRRDRAGRDRCDGVRRGRRSGPGEEHAAGGSKPAVPAVVPTPMPQTPQAPSVDPTCLPTVPARPQLPKVTVSVTKTIDPNAVPTGKPTLPAKPSLPSTRPSLPGKQVPTPTLPDCVHGVPTAQPSVPEPTMPGTPSLPTTEPSLPTPAVPTVTVSGGVKITIDPGKQLPTGRPSIPGTPPYPTAKPTFPTTKPSLPTPSFPTGHPSSHR